MLGGISSITNSTDVKDVKSRVFIGNLNTVKIPRAEVESIFARYGSIKGCSIHKGYAFVQYTSEADARAAVAGEDGRLIVGQALDCNLVSEPKTNRPKQGQKSRPSPPSPHLRKHPAINGHIAYKPPLCFMYELCPPGRPACRFAPSHGFHDHGPPPPLLIGPAIPKRPRLGPPLAVAMRRSQSRMIRHTNMSNDGDILICGRCKRLFSNIHRLQHHKLVGCRPHVTCGCRKKDLKVDDFAGDQPPASLSCAECGQPCSSPWELLQHASLQHDNTIYLQDPDREGEGGQITLGDAEGSEGKASLEMESDVTSSVSGESMDEQMNGFVTDLKLETGR
ncbi:PREDICTED: serine/arginine-rich splicing factor 7-like [Branchiostoma belcheri]|uniref:Serine/arginine-rich splicing factor 7-like n=1 Tax=Branchiostoma belcheri TaxID=7741 RepID=A0A6P4Z0N6_BRABE|nr:PREDICTED: serine/arginine-rich splicing factor 7-like [Branchiostoma belcheri]